MDLNIEHLRDMFAVGTPTSEPTQKPKKCETFTPGSIGSQSGKILPDKHIPKARPFGKTEEGEKSSAGDIWGEDEIETMPTHDPRQRPDSTDTYVQE